MAFTRPKAAQIDFDVTNISDPLIRLNSAETGSADKDVGIVIERGDDTNVAIIYDESADQFVLVNTTETGTTSGNVTIASYAGLQANGIVYGSLNDGTTTLTSTVAELNYVDGVTSAIQTQIDNISSSFTLAADSGSNDTFTTGQTLTIAGGTGIDTTVSDNNISIAIDSTVTTLTGSQTLTNKTLTTPVISSISNTGTLTLPTDTDTLIGRATTDTLTNKSIDSDNNTITNIVNADIKSSAAIAFSKMENLTNARALVSDGNGDVSVSAVTATEIGYLDGVSSAIQTQLDAKAPLAAPAFTGTATGVNLTLSGDLTVNGTTTTVASTNTVISDNLIELNNGASSNANDSGIVIERGSTGDNAFIGWDESADKFIVGTTTATGASTGDLTITTGTLVANIEGNITGAVTGNADTATTLETARNIAGQSFDGSAAITIASTDLSDTSSIALLTSSQTLTNKTIDSASNTLTLDLSEGTLTGTTAEFNTALSDGSFVTLAGSETLTNKTLTSPTINAFSGTGNGSITGTLSIVTTTTDDSLLITTTEDSSSAAPVLTLKRNSSSVADADYLGQIKFKGENDADQEVIYAKITGKILDASDGTEDGILEFAHKKAGSNVITSRFRSDSYQLLNGTQLSVDGTARFNGITVNSSQTINMGSNRITTVADPTSAQDAATKAYVDSEIAGSSGDSVFSSDADFDAVTATATVTEDLAAVTDSVATSLDLGTISVQGIVTSTAIVDANVTTAKIADDAVTSVKLSGLTNSSSGIIQADGDGTFSIGSGGGLSNVVEDTTPQLGGNLDTNGNNINFGDNDTASFGASGDLSINHTGTNSFITDSGTGSLYIQGSSGVFIRSGDGGETLASFADDGAATLYHDNSAKIATTATGIEVTGNILPEANGTRDLGSASLRWQNIYTSDLNLNNGVGNYTMVEGEEDLFLYNNKSGKVFKFALIEVDPSEATPKIEDLKNGSVR